MSGGKIGALFFSRIKLAFTTIPSARILFQCTLVFGGYALLALPIGVVSGFFRAERLDGSWRKFFIVPMTLLIHPGLIEETLFRILLIPHPRESVSPREKIIASAGSLILFVLYHPLNGILLTHSAKSLFTNLAFLTQASLLGLICTVCYVLSGSVWLPILAHWLPVTTWILFLGGGKRIGRAKAFNAL